MDDIDPTEWIFPFKNLVFEGGGNKGIAHCGALKYLEEVGVMDQIQRVAGASAGSIMAALVAVGHTAEHIGNEMKQKDMKNMFKDSRWYQVPWNLFKSFGMYKADGIYDWLGEQLALKVRAKLKEGFTDEELKKKLKIDELMKKPEDITFEQVHEIFGRELCVVVTNLSRMSAEYCHPKTTPTLPVREAVHMSASLPGLFTAKTYRLYDDNDIFVGGGLLCNYPIHCFDGDVRAYEGWKAAFLACVDKAPATSEYKLLQLRQYLSGEAAKVIDKLGHSAAAYEIALQRLDRKYGGRRRQIALKLEEVTSFKPIRPGNSADFEKFADMLDIAVVSLRETDQCEELGSGCLYAQLLKKMTEEMVTRYQRWLFDYQRSESVETLREWVLLESEFQTIASEMIHGVAEKGKVAGQISDRKPHTFFGTEHDSTKHCLMCKSTNHNLWSCQKFKALDSSQRWDAAKNLKLCFKCLGTDHRAATCSKIDKCGVEGCQATHNILLHFERSKHMKQYNSVAKEDKATQSSITMSSSQDLYFTALRTVSVVLKNGSRRITVNALLDDASTNKYLNEKVAFELGLKGEHQSMTVNVLNNGKEVFDSMLVEVGLESLDGSIDMPIKCHTMSKVTGRMAVIDWQRYATKWKHLRDIQFPKVSSRPVVDILIGTDYLELHYSQGDVCGNPGEPVARMTPLGWTCIGNVSRQGEHFINVSRSFFTGSIESLGFDDVIQEIWEVEPLETTKPLLTEAGTSGKFQKGQAEVIVESERIVDSERDSEEGPQEECKEFWKASQDSKQERVDSSCKRESDRNKNCGKQESRVESSLLSMRRHRRGDIEVRQNRRESWGCWSKSKTKDFNLKAKRRRSASYLPNHIDKHHFEPENMVRGKENMVLFFGWRNPFSQHHPATFTVKGKEFNCAEQYYMYSKAVLFGAKEIENKIMNSSEPKEQKKFGRQIANFDFDIWMQHSVDVVRKGNLAKFSQNPDLKTKLLVDASPGDSTWGIGRGKHDFQAWDMSMWRGENLLGFNRDELMKAEPNWLENRKKEIGGENWMKEGQDRRRSRSDWFRGDSDGGIADSEYRSREDRNRDRRSTYGGREGWHFRRYSENYEGLRKSEHRWGDRRDHKRRETETGGIW